MAANVDPVFAKEPYVKCQSYTNSDSAATKKDLVPAADVPTEGLRIDQISMTSTDTSARVIKFHQHDGSTTFLIGAVNVAIAAGSDGSAAMQDAILTLAPGTGFIMIPTGHKLQVENVAQVTSGKEIDIVARGGKLTA